LEEEDTLNLPQFNGDFYYATLYKFAEQPLGVDTDISGLERVLLGTVAEVRDLVTKQMPEVEWEAFYTGNYQGDNFRLDFFVGNYDSDEEDVIDRS
jgi:hypothetical protein